MKLPLLLNATGVNWLKADSWWSTTLSRNRSAKDSVGDQSKGPGPSPTWECELVSLLLCNLLVTGYSGWETTFSTAHLSALVTLYQVRLTLSQTREDIPIDAVR